MVDPGRPCCLCQPHTDRLELRVVTSGMVAHTPACAGCGRRLVASPGSMDLVSRGLAQPACPDCLPAGPLVPVMTGRQARELTAMERAEAGRN